MRRETWVEGGIVLFSETKNSRYQDHVSWALIGLDAGCAAGFSEDVGKHAVVS